MAFWVAPFNDLSVDNLTTFVSISKNSNQVDPPPPPLYQKLMISSASYLLLNVLFAPRIVNLWIGSGGGGGGLLYISILLQLESEASFTTGNCC